MRPALSTPLSGWSSSAEEPIAHRGEEADKLPGNEFRGSWQLEMRPLVSKKALSDGVLDNAERSPVASMVTEPPAYGRHSRRHYNVIEIGRGVRRLLVPGRIKM